MTPSPHRAARTQGWRGQVAGWPAGRWALVSAFLLITAAVILLTEPVTGPHLFHVIGSHGVDAGDLLAVPPGLLGLSAAARAWRTHTER